MGKHCGYEEYEDGSIKIAPSHYQKIDDAVIQEMALNVLLAALTEQCQKLFVPVIEGCGGQVFIWCKAGNICEMCGETVGVKKAMALYIIKQRAYDDLIVFKARIEKLERGAEAAKKIDPMVRAILTSWADAPAPVKEQILNSWMKELTIISLMLGAALKDLEAKDGK